MNKLIQWHKDILNDIAHGFNLSFYQMAWLAWAKGVVIGYLIGTYL
tara:strand:+ start:390 stop:527 length:138 start_codon:yes stop_codon:yes gene_type:complete